MKIKHIYLFVILASCWAISLYSQSLIMGSIQFPRELPSVPSVRIYYSGKIIKCTADQEHKRITFSLPKFGRQFRYSIVVTPALDFATTPQVDATMISFMKLAQGQDYKMFNLFLAPKFADPNDTHAKLEYNWRVNNDFIFNQERKIPDDAIVICMDPMWVDRFAPATEFELPTLHIKSDIATLCGSQENFYDESTKILLAAMDSDAFHDAYSKEHIKQRDNCIMIAAPVA